MDEKHFWIRYRFDFADGCSKDFFLELEKPGLHLVTTTKSPYPAWTRLTHFQCPNCPLAPAPDAYCPVAVNLVGVIEAFNDVISHHEADVEVITESRRYSARVNVTHAVGSLIGVFMATSGCPIMDRLKPMVLTHLPFPTTEESIYRTIATYMMAQYFRSKNGLSADWTLADFPKFFDDIQLVNQSFVRRLTTYVERDVSLNAVVLLNCFATAAKRFISTERIDEVEQMFEAYLDQPPKAAPGGLREVVPMADAGATISEPGTQHAVDNGRECP